jgi:hypothetical protein
VTAVVYAAHRYVGWGAAVNGDDPTFTVRFK